jgi:hypothetical protein
VGTYELGTPEEEVNSLLNALQRLGQETALVIPKEISVEWLQSQGRPEVYTDLINYIDQQISYVLCGETTAGQDTGGAGSYARDQISDSIRKRKAKAFSEELDETLNNTLIRWVVELNYPGHLPPTIKRNFDDLRQKDDPIKLVQLLTQMNAIGYKVGDLDWVKDKLDIPSLYVDEQGDATNQNYSATKGKTDSIDFADTDEMAKDIVDKALGGGGDEQAPAAPAAMPAVPGGTPPAVPGAMAPPAVPGAAAPGGNSKYSLQKSIYEQSRSQKLSNTIIEKLHGAYDDVGFNRIIVDASGHSASMSRLHCDEFTTPGEVIHASNQILTETQKYFSSVVMNPEDHQMYSVYTLLHQDIKAYEDVIRTNTLTQEIYEELKYAYAKAYRLNRKVVYGECVVLDPRAVGYWQYFKPYTTAA